MQSKEGWPKPITESAVCDYSIHTREKELATANALRTCFNRIRGQLKHKTAYIFEFFDTFKEDSSAFETGLVTTTLYLWDVKEIVPLLTNRIKRKSTWNGFMYGFFTAGVLGLVVTFILELVK